MSAQKVFEQPEVYGDMYSGAGGLTQAMKEALEELAITNVQFIAINHWDIAIDSYRANNPLALTYCTSVDQVNPREVVPGRFIRLLCAAPECTGHSNARGGQPTNEQLRAGAMHVLHWCAELCIECLVMENVPEFMKWGPLGPDGRPIKKERGKYFQAFINGLRAMDYSVEYRVVCCADYGDPTTRKRFMLLAKRAVHGGAPPLIAYPEATHASPTLIAKMKASTMFADDAALLEPWLTARRNVICWDIPSKSIFFRKRPLALKTLQRVRAGLIKFGGEGGGPFLELLDRYIGIVYAETQDYKSALAKEAHTKLMSDGVCALRAELSPEVELRSFLSVFRRNSEGRSVDEPLPALCANGEHVALASAMLVNLKGQSTAASIDEPLPTQTGTPHLYLAEPFMLPHPHAKGDGPITIDAPMPTVTATSSDISVVEPFMIGAGGPTGSGRPSSVDEPMGTVLSEDHRSLVQPEAFILAHPMYQHAKDGESALLDSLDDPLRTVVGENGRGMKLCEPQFLVPQFGENDGQEMRTHDVDDPLPTVTSHGAGALVEAKAFLTDLAHGNGSEDPDKAAARRVGSVDEPIITVTGRSAPFLTEPKAFFVQYNGTGEAQSVDEPMRTQTAKDRFALVQTKIGPLYWDSSIGVFLDIHLRMLDPDRELKLAHSLPKSYILRGKREDQTKQVGNSVPVKMGKAMCKAVLSA